MHEVLVPTINSNDESAKIHEWCVADGDPVEAGQVIAILETSKATHDLLCEAQGYIRLLREAGDTCPNGDPIARVFANVEDLAADEARGDVSPPASRDADQPALVISKKAQALIDQHGLTSADLLGLGKSAIKVRDIEGLLGTRAGEKPSTPEAADRRSVARSGETTAVGVVQAQPCEENRLSVHQLAVGATVRLSHRTIPASFASARIYCDAAVRELKAFAEREKVMVGLPELLLFVLGRIAPKHPLFFGRMIDDEHFVPSETPAIGVTLDLGKGLYIPVLRDPGHLSLREIGGAMMKLRAKALRGRFKEEDLAGGDMTLSLNVDEGILTVVPIILPPQTSMLSLGAVFDEAYLDGEDRVRRRSYLHLGLSYDHRVVNGAEATRFLCALNGALEDPAAVPGSSDLDRIANG